MEVIDIQSVKDCLAEVSDCEYFELDLEEHDKKLLDKVAEKLKARHYYMETEEGWGGYTVTDKDIDEVISEIKAEVEQ